MSARSLLAVGLAVLIMAQVVAGLAWRQRPAAALGNGEDEASLAQTFIEIEPGEFAGTLLLGGLRGLVTDILWLRADTAKSAGRYYESLALYQLISRVQPRFEQVWEYMAHDLSYNIAAESRNDESWGWFLAGVEAIERGCWRNPRSDRLLRYAAWMFFHKGESWAAEIAGHDWSGRWNRQFARFPAATALLPVGSGTVADDGTLVVSAGAFTPGDQVVVTSDGQQHGRGRVVAANGRLEVHGVEAHDCRLSLALSNYQLARRIYNAALALAAERDKRAPVQVRRLIAMSYEYDGNLRRNRGDHHGALLAYLDGLEDWQAVLRWQKDPLNDPGPDLRAMTEESYQRNEGRQRTVAADLARRLAPDPLTAAQVASAISERDFARARTLLALPGWHQSVADAGAVRWYDEAARQR
ncbi:MAG: hypothetical protein ACYTF0_01625 [Planctomycetota bacterium]|jgi:hypothetical protein